ncbi:putative Pro-resilin-like 183, partial [Homarus americanus]
MSLVRLNTTKTIREARPSGDFGHQETRDGDNTQGPHVQLPDGRLKTVTYFADGDSGYIADVKYDGGSLPRLIRVL